MHVSLSEVQTNVCKAAVAVGLPLGLGEDAGEVVERAEDGDIGIRQRAVDGEKRDAIASFSSRLDQASSSLMTCPWISVRRKSRPW